MQRRAIPLEGAVAPLAALLPNMYGVCLHCIACSPISRNAGKQPCCIGPTTMLEGILASAQACVRRHVLAHLSMLATVAAFQLHMSHIPLLGSRTGLPLLPRYRCLTSLVRL